MSLKLNKENVIAWVIVGVLQLLALLILIPVAANIHHAYFAVFLGTSWAWLVTYVYAIVETVGLAMIPMMHTAWSSKKLRIAFPLSLVCFCVIFSFDVYMNNVVFKKKGVEYGKNAFIEELQEKNSMSEEIQLLRNRLEKERNFFSDEERSRQADRKNMRLTIRNLDSLSIIYAKAGNLKLSQRYSHSVELRRRELVQSDNASATNRKSLDALEENYLKAINKNIALTQKENDATTQLTEAGWLNNFCKHYPGVIFLVMAIFISGMTGFIIDKNHLIVYDVSVESKASARKKYLSMLLELFISKILNRHDHYAEKKLGLAAELVFSGDKNTATKELFELESTGGDRKYKAAGIFPRQVFAAKFGMSVQAVQQRLKSCDIDMDVQ